MEQQMGYLITEEYLNRLEQWSRVLFPGKNQNVYYYSMADGNIYGIAVYTRGVYKSNDYGEWLKPTYIIGNVTIQNGSTMPASMIPAQTINNLSSSQYVPDNLN